MGAMDGEGGLLPPAGRSLPPPSRRGGKWKEDGLDGEVRALCREAGRADGAREVVRRFLALLGMTEREYMAGESMRRRTTYERSGGDRPRGMIKGESTWRVEKREATRKGKSGTKGGSPDLNDKEEKHLAGRKAEETAGAERGGLLPPAGRSLPPPSKREAGGERRAWMGR